ncbi:hypothetical protein GBF38_018276, partial [Nibea albiflora]
PDQGPDQGPDQDPDQGPDHRHRSQSCSRDGAGQPQLERLLPQWLTGIIASSLGLLFVIFVTFLVKKSGGVKIPTGREEGRASERQNDVVMTTGKRVRDVTGHGHEGEHIDDTYETTRDMVREEQRERQRETPTRRLWTWSGETDL